MKKFSGETLRLKREEINLSLEEISHNIKISKRILKKIEDSNFENMSSFQKKYFTESYAKFLGIESKIKSSDSLKKKKLLSETKTSNAGNTNILIFNFLFPKIYIPIFIFTIGI